MVIQEKLNVIIKKISNNTNDNKKYFFTGITLLVICLLNITTIFVTNDYSLQLPFATLFGTVSWLVTIILGIVGIIVFKNVDKKQINLEKVFLILVIPIGILNCIVRPLGRVPDETYHARKAMAISQGNFFSSHVNEEGRATEFLNAKLNELVTNSSENYDEALSRLTMSETEDTVELEYTTMALYAPICHLPQAIRNVYYKNIWWNNSCTMLCSKISNFCVFSIFDL